MQLAEQSSNDFPVAGTIVVIIWIHVLCLGNTMCFYKVVCDQIAYMPWLDKKYNIYAFASLSMGEISKAKQTLEEIRNTLKTDKESVSKARVISAFIGAAAAVLLHLPLPAEMPSVQEFAPFLPFGLRAFTLYVEAHYFYLQKNYEKSIGIIESALTMGAEQYPIPAIYLHLAAVMDYMSLKQIGMAEKHLLKAWELARPDAISEE